ncbi:MAG TPA: acyltransferase family protein [Sphingobium sp.]|nr:acyltransferase family protein [Sphingobium sp.]
MSGGSEIGRKGSSGARLVWIDALKGLGMVAVIAGHVWTHGAVRDAIYAVHMPLFFLLSGYSISAMPWRRCLPRLACGLALPFVSFSILLLGADFLIEGLRGMRPIFPNWRAGAETILLATAQLRGPFTIFWFIPCLLGARLAWNALASDRRRPDSPAMMLVMAIIFALALAAQHLGGRSPLGLLAMPGALLLIWGGALWRLRMPVGQPWGAGRMLIVAAMALGTMLWLPPINMKVGDLGWPFVSLVGAGAVTVALAWLIHHLPQPAVRPLAAIGRASLVIMYAHVAFIHYLAPYASRAVLFAVALIGAWLLDWLIRRTALTRLLLRGEAKRPY